MQQRVAITKQVSMQGGLLMCLVACGEDKQFDGIESNTLVFIFGIDLNF